MNFLDEVTVIAGSYRGMTGFLLYRTGARWDYWRVSLYGDRPDEPRRGLSAGPNWEVSIKESFLELRKS